MDIDIKNEYGNFKLIVSAIIIKDKKILLVKSKSRDGYCFPSGHVELGETTSEAIARECFEELNIIVNKASLVTVLENIYTTNKGKMAQEVNYFYRISTNSDILNDHFELTEIDKGTAKKIFLIG